MSLKIETTLEDDIPVIKIEGELTRATTNQHMPLQTEILKRARLGNYKVIVDLSRTRFLDGKGLACLIEISEIVRLHEGKIGIVSNNDLYTRILKFEKFHDLFTVFDSLTEATFTLAEFVNP
ncbi:hypothetical protein COX95_04415 [bacterium CG_4_10_14_0_2_um_filter_33_32]|nr:MAG: hypothetical protein AUJ93_02495 [bacterium CG2_30_33_46]PIR67613.1 MAG: hypothetical protein COU50_02325 [bacterium CG10_big_fil_rev_8_21_14_0_10_33_18]PIU76957.1 MAG: hypothetical protein COS74_01295 [bacterium CG06_land_8_20_14_3_00_33_50]PIY85260.1 MAG: hypothetical protein COY76_03150 [bacterium CG_4_10_14_0_8_um_filter_33_57]PIZ85335.1 MAG: hypothetical protein COX95_04415 [bacterium CG_4_10_14_0_2_um_filter_33_32]PJA72634.1 MAG: hypothetical protein CO152_00465 [bacterium CG_4_9